MIDVQPYDADAALLVIQHLDQFDRQEVDLSRGGGMHLLDVFASWHAVQPGAVASWVFYTRSHGTTVPFAVCCAVPAGYAGVASAGFLSVHHQSFAAAIARAAVWLKQTFPLVARDAGLRRIEARSWALHPTAPRFLDNLGFRREARMPGFGPDGRAEFDLYAWTKGAT